MSTLIVGSEGFQGHRYRAILKFFSMSYLCSDISYSTPEVERGFHSIIIATPTKTHIDVIRKYLKYKRPILCEAPIAKDSKEVEMIFDECEKAKVPLSMIMPYRQLLPLGLLSRAKSYYNYFKHGNDGLAWDCLQIIGLARGEISLSELSPIWQCSINGYDLHLADIDKAYIRELTDWFQKIPHATPSQVIQLHQKVEAFAKGLK